MFALDYTALDADPRFAVLAGELEALGPIDSAAAFNRYCRAACRAWRAHFGAGVGHTSALFESLEARIARGDAETIATSWGGVAIELHQPPRVEKYLLIRRGGYLALETHELKDEHLQAREGAGLMLWRAVPDAPLRVEAVLPGAQFHLEPGREHCLIGTENLLVYERSSDPKGMDQDLIFLFEPDGNAA